VSEDGTLGDAVRREGLREGAGYQQVQAALANVRKQVQAAIAETLTPALNAHLDAQPQDTYSEKRHLASWVNHELHQLGLNIRCPLTGLPAILVADRRGDADEPSRFRLEVRDGTGRKRRTYCSQKLPVLDLVEEPPRRENFAARLGGDSAQSSR
jgi:hypothetical protein